MRIEELPSTANGRLAMKMHVVSLRLHHTIVNTIVPSSHPNWPPQQGNLAIIRIIKAIAATTSPAIPAIDTALVRSRTGAWHAVWVTFFVAKTN